MIHDIADLPLRIAVEALPDALASRVALQNLDADIRALELYLDACGVRLHQQLNLENETILAWRQLGGHWRIVVSRPSVGLLPLIDAPTDTRIELFPQLAELVRLIAARVRESLR